MGFSQVCHDSTHVKAVREGHLSELLIKTKDFFSWFVKASGWPETLIFFADMNGGDWGTEIGEKLKFACDNNEVGMRVKLSFHDGSFETYYGIKKVESDLELIFAGERFRIRDGLESAFAGKLCEHVSVQIKAKKPKV